MTTFKHPTNGYTESVSFAPLWWILFGPLYFLYKGAVRQFFISMIICGATVGLAWIIYPFFAHDIVCRYYRRNGWLQIPEFDFKKPSWLK